MKNIPSPLVITASETRTKEQKIIFLLDERNRTNPDEINNK